MRPENPNSVRELLFNERDSAFSLDPEEKGQVVPHFRKLLQTGGTPLRLILIFKSNTWVIFRIAGVTFMDMQISNKNIFSGASKNNLNYRVVLII